MFIDTKEEKHELKIKLMLMTVMILALLLIGMLVYHFSEGWSMLDSLYFSAISLSTRGFSDMYPTTWVSVLFSIFYLFLGVAIIIYGISTLIAYYTSFYEKKVSAMVKNIRKQKEIPDKWIELRPKNKH